MNLEWSKGAHLCADACGLADPADPSGATAHPSSTGRLELVLGPMFAGKTTELIRRVRRAEMARYNVVVINHVSDTRYRPQDRVRVGVEKDKTVQTVETVETVVTHDRQSFRAIGLARLSELPRDLFQKTQWIGVDEGQFFPDLFEQVVDWVRRGKTVIVSALDGTFAQEPFGHVFSLIPWCDIVLKLTAVCLVCGADAPFTIRTNLVRDTIQIGGAESYRAVCRACLFVHMNTRS